MIELKTIAGKVSYKPGDVLRIPDYPTNGGPNQKRVWKVAAVYLGGVGQESVYELATLDRLGSDLGVLLVPCQILESNPHIERV